MLRVSKLIQVALILKCVYPPTLALNTGQNLGALIQAQVMHRHGDRNPTSVYPTDPYGDEAFWPDGFGELTELGREQLYNLGVFLRQRYDKLLQKHYNKSEITVTSSCKDRAIMSAQAALAGLYQPENGTKSWNPYINWQLVPIHTIPRSNDSFLHLKAPCPKYSRDFKEFYSTSEYVRKLEAEHMPMIKYFRFHMGLPDDTTLQKLLTYQDTLMIQKQRGMKLPAWFNQTMFEELSSLKYLRFELDTYTPEFKRLRGGPILKELLGNMPNKNKQAKNVYLYSAHKSALGALMNTLGIFNHLLPPYASALMFELYQTNPENFDNNYFLRIYYYNETQSQPYLLEIPHCGQTCSLKHFSSLTHRYVPENWLQECELPVLDHVTEETSTVAITLI
ncbi:unnamed protein product, partial [Allacma fusca]